MQSERFMKRLITAFNVRAVAGGVIAMQTHPPSRPPAGEQRYVVGQPSNRISTRLRLFTLSTPHSNGILSPAPSMRGNYRAHCSAGCRCSGPGGMPWRRGIGTQPTRLILNVTGETHGHLDCLYVRNAHRRSAVGHVLMSRFDEQVHLAAVRSSRGRRRRGMGQRLASIERLARWNTQSLALSGNFPDMCAR